MDIALILHLCWLLLYTLWPYLWFSLHATRENSALVVVAAATFVAPPLTAASFDALPSTAAAFAAPPLVVVHMMSMELPDAAGGC